MAKEKFEYSGNVYEPVAGTTTFALTSSNGNEIKYLQPSHISVSKSTDNGFTYTALARPAEWDFSVDGKSVVLATATSAGDWIKIKRDTPYDDRYTTFVESSLLTADQLNTGEDFSMFVDQEIFDAAFTLSPIAIDGKPEVDDVLRYNGALWTNYRNHSIADQDSGKAWNDGQQATAGAIAKRHDTIIQNVGIPTGSNYQPGKFWYKDDTTKSLSIWTGDRWETLVSNNPNFTSLVNVIWVDSANGKDENDGHQLNLPKQHIKAAVEQANKASDEGKPGGDGAIIILMPGVYQEEASIVVTAKNLSIVGDSLRSTFIHPTKATELNSMFLVDSGFYLTGVTIAGLKADGVRGGGSLDPDATYGLPDKTAFVVEFRPAGTPAGRGAPVIRKSPYVQNCTAWSDAQIDNDNFDPNNLPGEGGDETSGATGGGALVDGSVVADNSPLRSMVIDSFTQISLGGPGLLVKKNGYCQAVSFFGTFCWYHCKALSGGQVNLSNSTSDFGQYGLIASGRSDAPIFSAELKTAVPKGGKTIALENYTKGTQWEPPRKLVPGDHMVVEIGGKSYPIIRVSGTAPDYEVEIFCPESDDIDDPKAYVNGGVKAAIEKPATANFYLQSYISTGGHTFEYCGAGTNYSSHPDFGGIPNDLSQAVEIGGTGDIAERLTYLNGGRIWLSSTDQEGLFRVGKTFSVNQKTGQITPNIAAVDVNLIVKDPGINMRGYKIYQDPSDAGTNAPLQLEPSGTGSIILGTDDFNSDGERIRPSPIMAPIMEQVPDQFKGIKVENLNAADPVLTQKDVGYDADQVAVCGLLGDMAFLDAPISVGINNSKVQPNQLGFSVSGTTLTITYQPPGGGSPLTTTLTLS